MGRIIVHRWYTIPTLLLVLFIVSIIFSTVSFAQTQETKLALTVHIHGIGNGGDNVNPSAVGNMTPLHLQRSVVIDVIDSTNSTLTRQGQITYNPSQGNFQGIIGLGTSKTGSFIIRIKTPQSLRKAYAGIITLNGVEQKNLPTISLITGDINNDNKLSILDYNGLLDCFSDLTPARNCSDAGKKMQADITDDGHVNQYDYNLLLREFSVQGGDGDTTPLPTQPHTTLHPTQPQVSGSNSMAMGKWSPSKWDTCTKDQHDAYKVQGPDGKWYPTWHPPLGPNGCKFGHDHGRNPTGYQYWSEVKQHFAYDANKNNTTDSSELATAGIPFGYVNEQMDSANLGFMRHEDHVGHKVEFANGEGDIGDGTDPFDSSKTGGVVVPVKNPNGNNPKWLASGVRCYHFHKIHQGVSTPDALTNNIHELIMHTKCTSTRNDFPASTTILSGLVPFGAPGEFTRFCGDNRNDIVQLGTTDVNKNFPGTRSDGMRNIITRDCVEQTVLVPQGSFSSFPYEIWSGELRIRNTAGTVIAENGGAWEVLDAIRYYNPSSSNKISYTASWCYESLGDRKARGGTCDAMTNYGTIKDITYDDPRSGYRGLHRGQYINAHRIHNNGGVQTWYSDPFGRNAKTTSFTGSVKQYISTVEADLIGKISFDPRIIIRNHDDGNNSVHAPN